MAALVLIGGYGWLKTLADKAEQIVRMAIDSGKIVGSSGDLINDDFSFSVYDFKTEDVATRFKTDGYVLCKIVVEN